MYGGVDRKDWRIVSPADEGRSERSSGGACSHAARANPAPAGSEVAEWVEILVAECRERLAALRPLRDAEMEFLRRLNDVGKIAAELITAEPAMQARGRALVAFVSFVPAQLDLFALHARLHDLKAFLDAAAT